MASATDETYKKDRSKYFQAFLDFYLKVAQTFSAEMIAICFPNEPNTKKDAFVHVSTQDSIFTRDMRHFIFQIINKNICAVDAFYKKEVGLFPDEVKYPKKFLSREMKRNMSLVGSWFIFLHRQSKIIFRWSTGRLPISTESINRIMTEALPAAYARNNALKDSSPSFSDKCCAVMEFVSKRSRRSPIIYEKYLADFEGKEVSLSDDDEDEE